MSQDSRQEDKDWFSFDMGEFSASFPRDRMYVRNHMWAKQTEQQTWRFGLTEYAVRLLQDVYFLDWLVEPPSAVSTKAHIGSIESKKAESDLFAPLAGQLCAINEQAMADPSIINADPYEAAWLLEFQTDDTEQLLDPDGYLEHLADAWKVAQRTIKGQANM